MQLLIHALSMEIEVWSSPIGCIIKWMRSTGATCGSCTSKGPSPVHANVTWLPLLVRDRPTSCRSGCTASSIVPRIRRTLRLPSDGPKTRSIVPGTEPLYCAPKSGLKRDLFVGGWKCFAPQCNRDGKQNEPGACRWELTSLNVLDQ